MGCCACSGSRYMPLNTLLATKQAGRGVCTQRFQVDTPVLQQCLKPFIKLYSLPSGKNARPGGKLLAKQSAHLITKLHCAPQKAWHIGSSPTGQLRVSIHAMHADQLPFLSQGLKYWNSTNGSMDFAEKRRAPTFRD